MWGSVRQVLCQEFWDPDLRKALARLGGPELATGVIERLMRELNARTDIAAASAGRSPGYATCSPS